MTTIAGMLKNPLYRPMIDHASAEFGPTHIEGDVARVHPRRAAPATFRTTAQRTATNRAAWRTLEDNEGTKDRGQRRPPTARKADT